MAGGRGIGGWLLVLAHELELPLVAGSFAGPELVLVLAVGLSPCEVGVARRCNCSLMNCMLLVLRRPGLPRRATRGFARETKR